MNIGWCCWVLHHCPPLFIPFISSLKIRGWSSPSIGPLSLSSFMKFQYTLSQTHSHIPSVFLNGMKAVPSTHKNTRDPFTHPQNYTHVTHPPRWYHKLTEIIRVHDINPYIHPTLIHLRIQNQTNSPPETFSFSHKKYLSPFMKKMSFISGLQRNEAGS